MGLSKLKQTEESIATLMSKRLVFAVTTGRSGTKFLARALGVLADVTARHEPRPEFVEVMRKAQQDSSIAHDFLVTKKLPAIATETGRVYVETSHLFCKGFLEPMISLGIVPDLIILRRPPRQVALSMLRIGSIPGASDWYLSPGDPGVLTLQNWEQLHDYQLCYWYCLEIERRAQEYSKIVVAKGATAVATDLAAMTTREGFTALVSGLNLPGASESELADFARLSRIRVNEKTDEKLDPGIMEPVFLDQLELEVAECVEAGIVNKVPDHLSSLSGSGDGRDARTRWIDGVNAVYDLIAELCRDEASVVLIDDGKLPGYVSEQAGVLPLPAKDGVYWGRPPDSQAAIRALDQQIEQGARYLLVARPAFWWLDHYAALGAHLRTHFSCISESKYALVFDLEAAVN